MPTQTISKPARQGRAVFYDALKAPQLRGDQDSSTPTLILVKNGTEVAIECSAKLFERVDGRNRRGGAHTGYDNLRDYAFVVWEHGKKAVDVDRINVTLQEYPDKTYSDEHNKQTTIDVEFTKDGSMHVIKTPPRISKKDLFEVVKALNGIEAPETEMKVAGRFEISEVTSKLIRLIVLKD